MAERWNIKKGKGHSDSAITGPQTDWIEVIARERVREVVEELEARAEKLRGDLHPVPREADPCIGGKLGRFNLDDMRRAQVVRLREAAQLLSDSMQANQ